MRGPFAASRQVSTPALVDGPVAVLGLALAVDVVDGFGAEIGGGVGLLCDPGGVGVLARELLRLAPAELEPTDDLRNPPLEFVLKKSKRPWFGTFGGPELVLRRMLTCPKLFLICFSQIKHEQK